MISIGFFSPWGQAAQQTTQRVGQLEVVEFLAPAFGFTTGLTCGFVPDFQLRMLRLMERLVEEDEVGRARYAYLHDRVNVNLGSPQRYGSQFHCVDGRLALQPLEQPDKINALRKEMGMGPIEQISPDEKCDN